MSTISSLSAWRERRAGVLIHAVGHTLKRWWEAYMGWRIERWAIGRLTAMSDRQLKDIGIARSQIAFAVKGRIQRDGVASRCI